MIVREMNGCQGDGCIFYRALRITKRSEFHYNTLELAIGP